MASDMTSVTLPAPDILAAMSPGDSVKNMTVRLKAEDTLDANVSGAFSLTDLGETYSLVVRKGVAQFYEGTVDGVAFTLKLERATLNEILDGGLTVDAGLGSGAISVAGSEESATQFLGYFEPVESTDDIRLLR